MIQFDTRRAARIFGALIAITILTEATPAQAQYSRYGGRSGYSGFGGRYGGFSYGGYGRGYSSSSRYGSSYRGYRSPISYGYGNFRYSPSFSPSYRYGTGFAPSYRGPSYRAPISRGSLYFRSSQVSPPTNFAPLQSITQAQSIARAQAVAPVQFAASAPSGFENNGRLDHGWQMLAAGNDEAALQYFAALADQDHSAAQPKVGFSLAAAACGDFSKSVWALQRALSLNPGVIDQLQQQPSFLNTRSQVLARLQQSPAASSQDAGYLVAALQPKAAMQKHEMGMEKPVMEMGAEQPKLEMVGVVDEITEAVPPLPTVATEADDMSTSESLLTPPLPTES